MNINLMNSLQKELDIYLKKETLEEQDILYIGAISSILSNKQNDLAEFEVVDYVKGSQIDNDLQKTIPYFAKYNDLKKAQMQKPTENNKHDMLKSFNDMLVLFDGILGQIEQGTVTQEEKQALYKMYVKHTNNVK